MSHECNKCSRQNKSVLICAILIAVGFFGLYLMADVMLVIVPPVLDAVMWLGRHVNNVIPHVVIAASVSTLLLLIATLTNVVGQLRPFPRMRTISYWSYFLVMPVTTPLFFGYLANKYSNLPHSCAMFFIWFMAFAFVKVVSLKPFDPRSSR